MLEQDHQHEIRFLIFDFQSVNGIDSSASFSFIRLEQLIANLNIQLVFTHCDSLKQQFEHQAGTNNIIMMQDLDQGMEWCENQLIKTIPTQLIPKEFMQNTLSQLTLDNQQQIIFKEYLEKIEAPAHFYLCREGEATDCLYFIESGQVSILLESNHSTIRLSKSGPGTIIGEVGFYLQAARSAHVLTETPCVIYKLTEKSMHELEKAHPDIALNLHKSIIHVLALRVVQTNYELRLMSQ